MQGDLIVLNEDLVAPQVERFHEFANGGVGINLAGATVDEHGNF
jgi:hypothetical protein